MNESVCVCLYLCEPVYVCVSAAVTYVCCESESELISTPSAGQLDEHTAKFSNRYSFTE